VAKPRTLPDGSTDLFLWECRIPGKAGSAWADSTEPYRLLISFPESYPVRGLAVGLPASCRRRLLPGDPNAQ
jgi:ubiquitin-conjugating enzyme E2 I